MGSGSSATATNILDKNVLLSKEFASRDSQGTQLGVEFENLILLKPNFTGVNVGAKYILRIGYEALVILRNDETKLPITYFKYQDVLNWNYSHNIFKFNVVGRIFSCHDAVSIEFVTPRGKEIESSLMASVLIMLGDMKRVGISKADFAVLLDILTSVKSFPVKIIDKEMENHHHHLENDPSTVGPASSMDNQTENSVLSPDTTDEHVITNKKSGEKVSLPLTPGPSPLTTAITSDVKIDNEDVNIDKIKSNQSKPEPAVPLTCEEFITTVEQFALSRSFSACQGVQLMELAMKNKNFDSFDRINFAVSLWKSTLNRDSFQLVINVFDDEGDRENVIARVKDLNVGKLSANLLSATCTGAGGGMVINTNTIKSKISKYEIVTS